MTRLQPAGEYKPISDYGVIGDCRTAALISRDGSIDWCCLPNFDSPSVFGRLVDLERGGHFSVRPSEPYEAHQSYIDGTNVLITTFTTPEGSVCLTDFMPIPSPDYVKHNISPMRQIIRHLEGLTGTVSMEVEFAPRPHYGSRPSYSQARSPHNLVLHGREWALHLLSDPPLRLLENLRAQGTFRLSAGEQATLSLAYDEQAPGVYPAMGLLATRLLEDTIGFWRWWLDHCTYQGKYQGAVHRSALLLKLLEFAPSGAIIAAPTTSLPEAIGGVRNWDYRFCWLRDASMTLQALQAIGYAEEARAFLDWMLHSTRLTHPQLQVVYTILGESSIPQKELRHLQGYRGSQPVRVGNQASGQHQLDVYGEVLDGVFRTEPEACEFSRDTRNFIAGAADYVSKHWRDADYGIWELQEKAQITHSKALCWLALDRALKLLARCKVSRKRMARWEEARDEIAAVVHGQGYNEEVGSFVQMLDGRDLDASVLSFPILGIVEARHPKMLSTVKAIKHGLSVNGHVYRYLADDGLPGREGAFSVCTFWLAHCLALQGDTAGACRTFENVLDCANHLGLLSEEVDPYSLAALGNFPQGLTHIGLIVTALAIQRAEEIKQADKTRQ